MPEYTARNAALWSKVGTNGVLGLSALELAANNDNIIFLTADLGVFSGLSRFATQYPEKFFNVGIAEQNMLGIAAGMATEGKLPYAVTYATFATMRAADQTRVCMSAMELPIRLVGVGSGLATGILGATHMGLEDIAVMRSIPNIMILSPADGMETMKAILASAEISAPIYIRLTGGLNNSVVYSEDYNFTPGKAIRLRDGDDLAILATGTMVYASLKAAELLAERGVEATVFDFHTLRPFDEIAVRSQMKTKLIVSVEEHFIIGGLGSAVAECLAACGNHPPLLRLGLNPTDGYPHADTYPNLLERFGLTPEAISQSVLKKLQIGHG